MQQAISWMTFFSTSPTLFPISSMYYCAISLPDSTHLCSSLIQTATDKKRVSRCPLTYSCPLTSLSFNVNVAQTDFFPIPTQRRNTLKDLEQEVLSYDKDYALLKPWRRESRPRFFR